jgi:predicted Zn-dependent protease
VIIFRTRPRSTQLRRPLGLTLILVALISCATAQKPQWDTKVLAKSSEPDVVLRDEEGRTIRRVSTTDIQNYVGVADALKSVSGINAQVRLIDDAKVNAFAGYSNGVPVIGINLGLIDKIAPNNDEFAALVGHELAHFSLHHYEATRTRRTLLTALSVIVGTALNVAGVPLGSTATDLAVQAIDTTFSRDQEEAADKLGLAFMYRAGFDCEGAVSLQRKVIAVGRTAPIPFLSTHPTGESRIAYLQQAEARDCQNGK